MILYQHNVLKLQNLSVVVASYAAYHFFSRTIPQIAELPHSDKLTMTDRRRLPRYPVFGGTVRNENKKLVFLVLSNLQNLSKVENLSC
jgi:hypothetical protein